MNDQPTHPLLSSAVLHAVRGGQLSWAVTTDHFAISEPVARSRPAASFLVRSSGVPITLGNPMTPFMNTRPLRQFMKTHGISALADTPQDVWLYHWVEKAQGPMIFEVGVVVDEALVCPENDQGFCIRRLPPSRFSSIIYKGPFPSEPNSGWSQIDWAGRAKAGGFVYTEKLYRELYHHYDHDHTHAHVTEIEISIE
jgi:hypothetical protein